MSNLTDRQALIIIKNILDRLDRRGKLTAYDIADVRGVVTAQIEPVGEAFDEFNPPEAWYFEKRMKFAERSPEDRAAVTDSWLNETGLDCYRRKSAERDAEFVSRSISYVIANAYRKASWNRRENT